MLKEVYELLTEEGINKEVNEEEEDTEIIYCINNKLAFDVDDNLYHIDCRKGIPKDSYDFVPIR